MAQNNLGVIYYNGEYARQDYKKAFDYYMMAAEQGNEIAQDNLADMYYYGEGVAQSIEQAKEWYGKSCDNGYKEACEIYRELND